MMIAMLDEYGRCRLNLMAVWQILDERCGDQSKIDDPQARQVVVVIELLSS
jgi:hypothetical protein